MFDKGLLFLAIIFILSISYLAHQTGKCRSLALEKGFVDYSLAGDKCYGIKNNEAILLK